MNSETKKAVWEDDFNMEAQYDLSASVPNPYAARFRKGTALILLEPDVAAKFPDSQSVNDALRKAIKPSPEELTRAG